jgi:hypothetical protein
MPAPPAIPALALAACFAAIAAGVYAPAAAAACCAGVDGFAIADDEEAEDEEPLEPLCCDSEDGFRAFSLLAFAFAFPFAFPASSFFTAFIMLGDIALKSSNEPKELLRFLCVPGTCSCPPILAVSSESGASPSVEFTLVDRLSLSVWISAGLKVCRMSRRDGWMR